MDYKKIITSAAGQVSASSEVKTLSARNIWGKIIIYLREHHAVALHIACGDITDVEFDGNTFFVNTTENFLYDLLKQQGF